VRVSAVCTILELAREHPVVDGADTISAMVLLSPLGSISPLTRDHLEIAATVIAHKYGA